MPAPPLMLQRSVLRERTSRYHRDVAHLTRETELAKRTVQCGLGVLVSVAIAYWAISRLRFLGYVMALWLGLFAIVCAVVGLYAARVAMRGGWRHRLAALFGLTVNGGFIGWLLYMMIRR